MNAKILVDFLKKVGEDDDLFRDFAALASEYGFDITEVSEEQLGDVSGGTSLSAALGPAPAISSASIGTAGDLAQKEQDVLAAQADAEMEEAKDGAAAAKEAYKQALAVLLAASGTTDVSTITRI